MTFHQHGRQSARTDNQILAIDGDIIGILQVDRQGLQLRVLDARYDILDGSRFVSRNQAEQAAARLHAVVNTRLHSR